MVESKMEIRIATTQDAGVLAKLGRETFHDAFANHPQMPKAALNLYLNEAFTVSQINSELNDPQSIFLLCERDGLAVGYAKLVRGDNEPAGVARNPIKLKRLYARKDLIGTGIGAGLLSRCLEEAGRGGHDMIWLTVWEHNQKAQDFYRKWDFKPCGIIDFQFGNTILTDFLMHRSL